MPSLHGSLLPLIGVAVLTATASAGDSETPTESYRDEMAAVEELREDLRFADAAQMVEDLLTREIKRSGDSAAADDLRAAYDELTRLQDLVDRVAQLKQAEEFEEAAELARTVLALELLHYGPDHSNVVECRRWCDSLDELYAIQRESWADKLKLIDRSLEQRNMDDAIGWTVALLRFKRSEFGNQHTEVSKELIRLATLEERDGRAQTAVPRYQEAVRRLTVVLGEDNWRVAEAQLDLRTAQAMARLARDDQYRLIHTEMRTMSVPADGEISDFESLCPQLEADLEMIEELIGTENRFYILTALNLGDVYTNLGRLADADRCYQDATDLIFACAGRSHSLAATALSRLAGNRSKLADHAVAVGYAQQAAELADEIHGPYSEDYLLRLRTLSYTLYFAGMPAESLAASERLLALHQEVRGPQHPETGSILTDLAHACLDNLRFEQARSYAHEALQAVLDTYGRDSRQYLRILNFVAQLDDDAGDTELASRRFDELAELSRRVYGPDHPDFARYLSSAAGHYHLHGQFEQAADMLEEVLAVQRRHLDESSSAQSERHQLEMVAATRGPLFAYLTCCVELDRRQTSAYEQLLAWKGAVSRQQSVVSRAARDPGARRLQQELQQVAGELAAETFRAAGQFGSADRKVLNDLWRRLGELEQQLASQAQSDQVSKVPTSGQLAADLPPHSALIDYCTYNHLIPDRSGEKLDFVDELRLLAFVVLPDQPARMVRLGPVAPIQTATDEWRALLQAGRGGSSSTVTPGMREPQDRLRRLVWDPIATHLDDVELALVSPDGPINEIPLAALPGSEPRRYLIDEMGFVTIPYSASLLNKLPFETNQNDADSSMLLVGDVDFGRHAESQTIVSRMASAEFVALPGTVREIDSIGELFADQFSEGQLTISRQEGASESFLRAASTQHRYLHFATHGFCILEDPLLFDANAENESADSLLTYLQHYVPELLSGIALADVNMPRVDDGAALPDDGILTALELSTLDLSHVELAVLSACETGLGQESTGEGMLGLQRALQIAGVRTAVTSLWKVDDTATQVLMTEFYSNLWQKRLNRSEALRQAQLTMLDHYDVASQRLRTRGATPVNRERFDSDRLPPAYWAAFCLSGAW